MDIKGELKRNGLPSLFRNFAAENFHGVLTITSTVGEKLITLTENEVTVYCDELNEASRLGNILIGRNHLSEDTLEQVLRDQKKLEPRPKLGDMLVQRQLVPEKAISDARRFQIEEDICDILSWKHSRFSFAGADSGREIHPEDFAFDQVHRMTIDPDSFFKYVSKVSEGWEAIGDRLPTQYLCFKVSPKTAEAVNTVSKDAQRVLRFLKEGRSIEGTVKQSCLGRVQVCVIVIELLEKGLILPASGADLRYMASEHRAQKRYHDALYIYRRLMESPDTKDDRAYLDNLINEISATIVKMKQSGEYGEEAVIVSHKGAKEKYIQSQRNRTIFWGVFGAAVALILVVLLILVYQPAADVPERYKSLIAKIDALVEGGQFNEAVQQMDAFLDTLPDRSDHVANLVQTRKTRIPELLRSYIENKVPPLFDQLRLGGEQRQTAVLELKRLLDDYPQNQLAPEIRSAIEPYLAVKTTVTNKLSNPNTVGPATDVLSDELIRTKKRADANFQLQRYAESKRDYDLLTQKAPATTEVYKQADAAIRAIQKIQRNVAELVKQAQAEWIEKKGDSALESIGQAIPKFGDLDGLTEAQALQARWLSARSTAQQLFKTGIDLEAKNSFFEAKTKFEQVAQSYPQFPIAAEARQRTEALKSKCNDLIKLITTAVDHVAKGDFAKARAIYGPLLEYNYSVLVDQKVEIPVNVSSIPSGSMLELNGKPMGVTPKDVLIVAGENFEITVKRPGFTSKRIASSRVTGRELNIPVKLELDPIIIDFPTGTMQPPAPLLAPPVMYGDKMLILNGTDLLAIDPPNRDILWAYRNLYDPRAPLPDNVPPDEKNYWNPRLAPQFYKPGFLLLPLRNKDLLEIDLAHSKTPSNDDRRSIFEKLSKPSAEIVGTMFVDEHSILAGSSILIAAFADGSVRCFADFDKKDKAVSLRWEISADQQDISKREPPVAGLYRYRNHVWLLSASGMLQAFDPVNKEAVCKRQFPLMSPRSTFSSKPDEALIALIERNGKVTLFDLEHQKELWSLPARKAMEESVGALIDETGVFITGRSADRGELIKYPRVSDPTGAAVKPLWSVALEGYVNIDMTSGKHLYLVTTANKVAAYSKKDLSLLWEFRMKPEMGEPKSIRAFGDYVYVSTDKGKIIVLKSE